MIGTRIKAFFAGIRKGFTGSDPDPEPHKTAFRWIMEERCPNCHEKDSLIGGPSGGMSQNVGCSNCGHHFNVTPALGMVEEFGKMSDDRARTTFGIDPKAYVA